MVPASFPESNVVFDKPDDMTRDQREPMSVLRTLAGDARVPVVISCWKLTRDEVDELLRTGRIWLTVCGMPPVHLAVAPPFERR